MKDGVLDFVRGNTPDRFCFACLATASQEPGGGEEIRAYVQVAIMRGERVSVGEGFCAGCEHHTTVVGVGSPAK